MSTAAEDKIREKRDRVLALGKGGTGEPIVTEGNYQLEMTKALSWYNAFEEDKTKRKWARTFCEKNGLVKELDLINSEAPDYLFSQIGPIMRLRSRGQFVSDTHWKKILEKIEFVRGYNEQKKNDQEELERKRGVKKAVDKTKILTDQCFDRINGVIDEFITTKEKSNFDLKSYLTSNNIPNSIIKSIGDEIQKTSKELSDIDYTDPENQLAEGYSNFTKSEIKKFQALIDGMVNSCKDKLVNERKPRKQKQVKAKPAAVLVANLPYMKSIIVGGTELKSINPESIVGAKELWIYETAARKIRVYRSEQGMSVHKARILGYDEATSHEKKVRKPETFFTTSLAKKTLTDTYNGLSTNEQRINPRTNENVILLKVFN